MREWNWHKLSSKQQSFQETHLCTWSSLFNLDGLVHDRSYSATQACTRDWTRIQLRTSAAANNACISLTLQSLTESTGLFYPAPEASQSAIDEAIGLLQMTGPSARHCLSRTSSKLVRTQTAIFDSYDKPCRCHCKWRIPNHDWKSTQLVSKVLLGHWLSCREQ